MKKNQLKREEGMPDVAQEFHKKKPIILVFMGIILITIFVMYVHSKSVVKVIEPIEETYTVQSKATPIESPPLTIQAPKLQPEAEKVLTQEQISFIKAKQNELQERLSAPLMLVNNAQSNKSDSTARVNELSSDRNTQFLNQVSAQPSETVTPKSIGPLNCVIAEGSLIHAILEPATNSDLPGFVRAIVSEPNYSEDGSQILIPRGSRLIGQYKSGMLQGQSRIFLVWTRLITPNALSVQLGSPGVDGLGVAGMGADEVNRHFWERFGSASLLSIIGAGVSTLGVSGGDQDNSVAAYRSAVANSFSQSADQTFQQEGKIPPTLTTYQGKPIIVFVAKDLNFSQVIAQVNTHLNIF